MATDFTRSHRVFFLELKIEQGRNNKASLKTFLTNEEKISITDERREAPIMLTSLAKLVMT